MQHFQLYRCFSELRARCKKESSQTTKTSNLHLLVTGTLWMWSLSQALCKLPESVLHQLEALKDFEIESIDTWKEEIGE